MENAQFRSSVDLVKENIKNSLRTRFGKELADATANDMYRATALTVRDEIMDNWTDTRRTIKRENEKVLYYLSFEFLMGRALGNNIMNLMETDIYKQAVKELGFDFSEVEEVEHDAGLGNGGLGRLAACFLDSLATLNYPAYGCGIRYEYGLFKQKIVDGFQTELPDDWLRDGNLWEIERPDDQVEVKFGGQVKEYWQEGHFRYEYENAYTVIAVPYDTPISGYSTEHMGTLRLWSAKSPMQMDMKAFNEGNYSQAVENQRFAEVISEVLYPDDNHYKGKELRLRQQYFFVSATLQWIIKQFKKTNDNLYELPKKVVIHINDTHPTLAIPEMMRLLMDEESLPWEDAWYIVSKLFAYTNHTIMSEALERWPVGLFNGILPRIYMIVHEMDRRLKENLREYYSDEGIIAKMAIESDNHIDMANMCFATCFAVNGVSQLHTRILVEKVAKNYYNLNPTKFHAITNGVTPRRWLLKANNELSDLISDTIGDNWITNTENLEHLAPYAADKAFQAEFKRVKQTKKEQLAYYIEKHNGIIVDTNSIFDVHVKRLHEYKRQLMNILHIMHLYNRILSGHGSDIYPRTFIFAAKAAPGYEMAKLIIKLINNVAAVINADPIVNGRIKIVFIENYGVSSAEKIISAAEVSEQISTAGMEASGTGNMKFMMNGALTIGTLDGANVEMSQLVGRDNIYIFGLTADEVAHKHAFDFKEVQDLYTHNLAINKVVNQLVDGTFDLGSPEIFQPIYNSLLLARYPDSFMVLRDFESYTITQEQINKDYQNQELWLEKAILNVSNSGYFSSDRTIEEYVSKIWKIWRTEN